MTIYRMHLRQGSFSRRMLEQDNICVGKRPPLWTRSSKADVDFGPHICVEPSRDSDLNDIQILVLRLDERIPALSKKQWMEDVQIVPVPSKYVGNPEQLQEWSLKRRNRPV